MADQPTHRSFAGEWTVRQTGDLPADAALYVWLDPGDLLDYFSDNFSHLTPCEERTVTFDRHADDAGENGTLADVLSVTHLRETY